jgi:hypothetical protein
MHSSKANTASVKLKEQDLKLLFFIKHASWLSALNLKSFSFTTL